MKGQARLSPDQIEQFIRQGYIRIENAFPRELAEEARDTLWKDIAAKPGEPSSWTQPVVRLGYYQQPPFVKAANTEILHTAFDQLLGVGKWMPLKSLGSFPVRFPSDEAPNDDGWHVDASYSEGTPQDFLSWRVNIHSRGRALLMLFLFSDVSEKDAPTRIRVGSHQLVASILHAYGAQGLPFMELAEKLEVTAHCEERFASGAAGTVYLCHPFLVHAAQPHRGSQPRFMAQANLMPSEEYVWHMDQQNVSPVGEAIRRAIEMNAK